MAKELNIRRLIALPSAVEPSTVYILKSQIPGKVDLMFVGDDTSDVRSILTIDDVNTRIMEVLNTWVPARSYKADALSQPFNLTLTGSVQGSASIDGSRNVTIVTTGGGGGGGLPAPQILLSETFQRTYDNIEGAPIETCIIPNAAWQPGSYGQMNSGVFTVDTFETNARLRFSADPQDQTVERPYAVRMKFWFSETMLKDAPVNNRISLQIGYGMTYDLYLSVDNDQTSYAFHNYTLLQLPKVQDWLMPLGGTREITVYFYRGHQIVTIKDVDSEVPSSYEYITHKVSTEPMDWSNFQLDFCQGIEMYGLEIFTF